MNKQQDKKGKKERSWHLQQEKILKDWGEASSCYRYMHFMAYQKFKSTSMSFTLPIIIISTFTGTANFAQETFPVSWQQYVPLGIGGLNLLAAILTTVLQFLKANELMEAHRVASISYGKLSRYIKLEMALPIYERGHDGQDMVERCKTEYDRLIEQSPPIPKDVLKKFDRKFPSDKRGFTRPEISEIDEIELFDSVKENKSMTSVANMFKKKLSNVNDITRAAFGLKKTTPTFDPVETKNQVKDELEALRNRNIVSVGQPGTESEPEPESEPEQLEEITISTSQE